MKITHSDSIVNRPRDRAIVVQLGTSLQYNETYTPWTLLTHISALRLSSPHPCSVSDLDMHLRALLLLWHLLHGRLCVLRISTQHQNFNRNRMTIRRNQQWHPIPNCYSNFLAGKLNQILMSSLIGLALVKDAGLLGWGKGG